ncbi:tripartite motif-containing protein 65-like [Solea senegalensis]|uniref:Tripartite motif-containing protein 65-like n=1 Tax=Solea senegalensis TaxID=28829 RepID=A0AAV6SBC9_SOLSE|nr:tripartite motif-containing protein 65-like [Solea senegalensis]
MWDGSDGKMAAAMVQMSCLYRGMLAVRATGIRTLIPGLIPAQFRAFSVRKEPELEENPYYNKYQDKIQKLRSSKPQEYKVRLEQRHEAKKEVLGHSKQAEFVRLMEQELEQRDKMAVGDGTSGGFTKNKMCQSYHSPASAGAPGSLTVSPNVSFGPVRRAVSDLKEQLQTLYHREFPAITSIKKANMAIPADVPDLDSRSSLLQNFVSLSLDPFTAHKELSLTDGNRAVSRTGQLHSYRDHPDRFDSWGQVLCREGLEGRSYWEAEWTGQQVGLGLTYESIGRKGSSNDCRLGHNSFSWGLSCNASSFTFCHGNESQALATPSSSVSNRIGVFVDFEAGMIRFYMATPRGVHLLHSLKTHFTQPLYPAVWLGANSTVTFCAVD